MRLPERGLVTETNNPGFRERPWRERGHAVIGGSGGGSLAQFLEFHPEDVVQIQAMRQFTRDVAIPRPAGVQVHLLQQQQIGLDGTEGSRESSETAIRARCSSSKCERNLATTAAADRTAIHYGSNQSLDVRAGVKVK